MIWRRWAFGILTVIAGMAAGRYAHYISIEDDVFGAAFLGGLTAFLFFSVVELCVLHWQQRHDEEKQGGDP